MSLSVSWKLLLSCRKRFQWGDCSRSSVRHSWTSVWRSRWTDSVGWAVVERLNVYVGWLFQIVEAGVKYVLFCWYRQFSNLPKKIYGCTSTYLWLNDYCGILFQFDSKYVFIKLKFFAVLGPRTWCNVKSGMPSFTSICAMSRPCGAKSRKNCPE